MLIVCDESPLFGSQAPGAPDVSGKTTLVRNVDPSAKSALQFVTLDFVYKCLG